MSVDVDRVLSEKVHSESFSKDTDDSFETALNSHYSIDSISVGQISRPSVIGTSAFGYDGTDDGCDNVGGDVGQQQQSQYPMSPFTWTQFNDSSNETNIYPPYVISYGQPSSSTDEEYNMPSHSPSTKMSYNSYHIPYQMQGGFDISTWVNPEYPIHVETMGRTQEIYA
ncbi:hypothetical protein CK203_053074 [Vitis vinifera]|uniref:Uncharacterized protein n=1 Tax=Vitis vinifera TaxID=29760 RepID=A0A438FL48_VITVI|nr:hypothetical protein CK203_053074 [Vitis vinifera]